MKTNPFERFENAVTVQEILELQSMVNKVGYSCFSLLIEGFKQKIKRADDDEAMKVAALLDKAKKVFPEPGKFSPSWERIWIELEQITVFKAKILQSIPLEERDGEWQVVMDNPNTSQEVVCYPGLPFLEAAYLYGYFQPDLKKNEYIRLQKIQNLVMDFGY